MKTIRRNCSTRSERRQGNIATLFAVLLPMLCAFIMLTIDVGLMAVDKTQLQRTADAAALAAVQDLGGVAEQAKQDARESATDYVTSNSVLNGEPVVFDPTTDVEFGQTHLSEQTGAAVFVAGAEPANAVRVTVRHNLRHTGFASLWQKSSSLIAAQAIASKKARDYLIVLDNSCPTTTLTESCEVCWDLHDLGIRDCEECDTNSSSDKDSKNSNSKDKDKNSKDKDKNSSQSSFRSVLEAEQLAWRVQQSRTRQLAHDHRMTEFAATDSYFGYYGSKDKDKDSKDTDSKDKDSKDKDSKDKDSKDKDSKDKDSDDTDVSVDVSCCFCPDITASVNESVVNVSTKDKDKDGGSDKKSAVETAFEYVYDGSDSRYFNIYEVDERFLPPSVRVQPLKSIKDAAISAVDLVVDSGLDDQLGSISYSSQVDWIEQLTTNYESIRRKIEGAAPAPGAQLDLAISAGVSELTSSRSRSQAQKVMVIVSAGATANSGLALLEAQAASDANIKIYTVGVGGTADTSLLDTISSMTGGRSFYVNIDASNYSSVMESIFNQVSLDLAPNQLIEN